MFSRFKYHILIFLALTSILVGLALMSVERPDLLEVYFFDVGEGDSILIETPDNNQILIDGGPNNSVVQKVGRTMPFYDRKIELIILTHPDSDHLRGLVEVLKRYDADLILASNIKCDTAICKEWDKIVSDKKIPVKLVMAGEVVNLGENLTLKILYPFSDAVADGDNSGSIVARLDYGTDSFLFTGDMEKNTEDILIKNGINVSADVLKVAHHGSKTSTTESFLKLVNPEIAVISVGKNNRYGHPADEILARLNQFGLDILRTDENGDVKIFSNGEKLMIQQSGQAY